MHIHVTETIPLELHGETTDIQIEISFDGKEPGDLQSALEAVAAHFGGTRPERRQIPSIPAPGGNHARPETPAQGFVWRKPDLHAKAMKSVHQVVRALADAGGKGLTVSEIQDKARISAQPAYKMLRDDHPQGEYAARFLHVTKVGRTQVVDLKKEGRQLASLIRAGKVPA